MSLDQLRELRRARHRPASVVVLIGRAEVEETPGIVQVDDSSDLRPLIGLPVHVIDLQNDPARTVRVIEALEALNVKPLGICGPAGSCGVSPEHEWAMSAYRETLCKS